MHPDFLNQYPAKYQQLLDDEIWEYIERCESFFPSDNTDPSLDEKRSFYNRLCQEFSAGFAEKVDSESALANANGVTVACRVYKHRDLTSPVTVVYLHGGGYVLGDLESHDDICAEICFETGLRVVSADYRLAPEHPHPAAFFDAMAVIVWALGHYSTPVILCGDSAGGNLAAASAHRLRAQQLDIVGQLLVYPALSSIGTHGSYQRHAQAPGLTTEEMQVFEQLRLAGERDENDPTLYPLNDNDFAALPPTVVFAAECDPLCDDGFNYCDAISASGGRAQFVHEPGLIHGYLRARHSVKRARESFQRIVRSLDMLAMRQWLDIND